MMTEPSGRWVTQPRKSAFKVKTRGFVSTSVAHQDVEIAIFAFPNMILTLNKGFNL